MSVPISIFFSSNNKDVIIQRSSKRLVVSSLKRTHLKLSYFHFQDTPSPAPVYSRDLDMVFEKDESSTKKGTQNKSKSTKVDSREKLRLDKPASGLVTNPFFHLAFFIPRTHPCLLSARQTSKQK